MKMRFILPMMMLLFVCSPLQAQWNTNNVPVTFFDTVGKGEFYGCNPKVARTKDGKTWISYIIYEYDYSTGLELFLGYHTYLQLIDANGVKQFPDPGIKVNDYMTPSWNSDYGLAVASDGSALVTVADSRSNEDQVFHPAIYKIGQDGSFQWGKDGKSFPDYDAPYGDIAVIGDDIYYQFIAVEGSFMVGYMMRYDLEGNEGWPALQQLGGQIAPCQGTDFILLSGGVDGSYATRLTRDLKVVWSTKFDEHTGDSYNLKPYVFAPDGEGGVAVAFIRYMGQFGHNIRVQHITADGDPTFGLNGLDAYNEEDMEHTLPGIAVNGKTKEILVDWNADLRDVVTRSMCKFDFGGNYLWGERGVPIDQKEKGGDFSFSNIGSVALEDSSWMVAYFLTEDIYSEDVITSSTVVVKRIDKDGKTVWEKNIGQYIEPEDRQMVTDGEYSYIFWRDEVEGNQGIAGFRIHNTDGDLTKIKNVDAEAVTGKEREAVYYSVDGKRLPKARKGLNLVRYSDGRVEKVLK